MCNEKNKQVHKGTKQDYRFLDYRLDQLEINLRRGQEQLEQEQKNNYKELIKMLQLVQEGNNELNKQLVELAQRQKSVEEKLPCIDSLKEVATKHNTEIKELERRMEIYKQILMLVGTGVIISLLSQVIHI